ncbi:MAG: hypothetical protein N2Z67_09380 [Acetobacteraceae bacterium]|nr:hypothetical protein [Acetobacteraceae bacterium]MDW8399642.1 hypothetical protein [Acetobacteraceae bacterium]
MIALRLLPPALLLAACVATPPGDPPATGSDVQPAAFGAARPDLARAAAALPATAAGFARGGQADLERRHPGRGISVDYATGDRSAAATVALYDLGQRSVPADPDSAPQRAEFEASVRELTSLPPERTGRRFTERERFRLPVPGGPAFACADLDGMLGRNPVRQTLCVGGAQNRFVKVQVMTVARDGPADARAFVAAIGEAARGR